MHYWNFLHIQVDHCKWKNFTVADIGRDTLVAQTQQYILHKVTLQKFDTGEQMFVLMHALESHSLQRSWIHALNFEDKENWLERNFFTYMYSVTRSVSVSN